MRKVKFTPMSEDIYADVTPGKVYDVIKNIGDFILISNDNDVVDYYFIYSGDKLEFIDVTIEIRNETINYILEDV